MAAEGEASAYERQRLANIQANQAKLATLGLAPAPPRQHAPGVRRCQARSFERGREGV